MEPETQAKWKVQFLWPFKLNYWIIDLEPNYEYAVIGEPDRENVWILSRKPKINEKLLSRIIQETKNKGYDLSSLVWTPQDPRHSQCLAQQVAEPEKKSNEQFC